MLKPVKFKKCWNIFVGTSAVIMLLVCLSFMDKKQIHNSRPYMLFPSVWNLSAFKNRKMFSGVSILENTSEHVGVSSSSLQGLTDLTSNQTSKPFTNVTYHGHDFLKDVSILASRLLALILLLPCGGVGLPDKYIACCFFYLIVDELFSVID